MNLKDQVLSIEQVQELQELGFDVNKHSSLKSNGKQIIVQDDFYIGGAPLFPTMSIGDIIDILPKEIFVNDISYEITILNKQVCYYNFFSNYYIIVNCGKTNIKALYRALRWCIKEKHITI